MSDSVALHPITKQAIYFTENNHRYTSDDKIYTSVTTLIGKLYPPFKKDEISERVAKKRGITKKQVLQEWTKLGDDACELGNNVHYFNEMYMTGQKLKCPKPKNKKEHTFMTQGVKMCNYLLKRFILIECEKIIFSPTYMLAGMIDVVMTDPINGDIILIDWKTNKEIIQTNKYKEFGYHPITHLPHNNYTEYSLQLNMYRKLLITENYYPGRNIRMGIIHFNMESAVSYPIAPMDEEIDNICNVVQNELNELYKILNDNKKKVDNGSIHTC